MTQKPKNVIFEYKLLFSESSDNLDAWITLFYYHYLHQFFERIPSSHEKKSFVTKYVSRLKLLILTLAGK